MTRPARVIINPDAARNNLATVRRYAPQACVLAVIKADAYGHGIVRMAGLFNQADAFAVAALEEAVELREAGITKPVVLLEGPFEASELPLIKQLQLEIVVHNCEQLDMLVSANMSLPLWLKFDTGMHRLGFAPEQVQQVYARAQAIAANIRFMTHFANAHQRGDSKTAAQIKRFDELAACYPHEQSLANSGAIITAPESHRQWVRPGLMLYGVSPISDESALSLELEPVMTLRSKLIATRTVAAGESVGYGASYQCPETMPVGVVAYGYGDGYPRHAKTGTPVLVNGVRTQVIGECSMDMMTVDLRPVAAAKFGDPVTLWGAGLPIEAVAAACGTIPYELLCRVRMRAHYEEGIP